MIVSHRHRFIFLKTRKTAGTSLEIALSQYCGPDDIITAILPEDEKIRAEAGYPGPQNYRVGKRAIRNHDSASVAREIVGPEAWQAYFKFTIERNPFDRAVSRYWWMTKSKVFPPKISEFLRTVPDDLMSNWPIYTIDDQIAVDHVIRYEALDTELPALSQRLGIGSLTMPHAKGGHRRDRRPYTQVLSAADRRLIGRLCAREFEAFGYEW